MRTGYGLPIDAVLPELRRALAQGRNAVLQAPPGAGKTTGVPPALLHEDWLGGRRIVMLEPRRLAARAAAARMAELLGEAVGETVGYRIRMESKVGPATRIEVVTEGILTRRLQSDPGLQGVGAVIFDEFHERSLHADLGLALCLEVQAALRDDLRLLVMSATLDGAAVARLLGGAPIVSSEGRSFPVETRYLGKPPPQALAESMASAVRRALGEAEGDVLAFLPGEAEIRRVERLLRERDLGERVFLTPLYGALPRESQDLALRPAAPGRRKVTLATAIAETSLTIEGVRVVVDSGLSRLPRFDPRSGMTRLETVAVSQASAEQRRGRAGRLGPGVCYRLWTEAAERGLPAFHPPEILAADLAPLVLDLAHWGASDPAQLAWLDPPPAAALAQARELLRRLQALDGAGRITRHGRAMAALPLHPRLAHMMLRGRTLGLGGLACDVAAVLGERDPVRAGPGGRDADLRLRVELLREPAAARRLPAGLSVDEPALRLARQAARSWRRDLRVKDETAGTEAVGRLLALAYPDRIAQRRPGGSGQFRLSNGRGAVLPETEPLAAADWLAVAALDAGARDARIFLAAPVRPEELEADFADAIETVSFVRWDEREEAVVARRQERLGELALSDAPLADPPAGEVTAAMLDGIRRLGIGCLPWTPALRQLQARVRLLRRHDAAPGGWPDLDDEALARTLEEWLTPVLGGIARRSQLSRLDLGAALRSRLDWPQQQALDEAAPTHLAVPSGSRLPLDYTGGPAPVLAVRLQEMFGARETPAVLRGRLPVMLHLLSPAGRPVQVTQDLPSFWANAYPQVKRDLKGRYPKHYWPDDPLQAEPTARAKRRGS